MLKDIFSYALQALQECVVFEATLKIQRRRNHLKQKVNTTLILIEEPYSQLTPLSGVAVQYRPASLHRLEPCLKLPLLKSHAIIILLNK